MTEENICFIVHSGKKEVFICAIFDSKSDMLIQDE